MTQFKASVQYGDFKGTAAADNADGEHDLNHFLKGKGMIQDGEFLVAASMWVGESSGGKLGRSYVKAYLYDKGDSNHDTVKAAIDATEGPISVRAVDIEVTPEQFISFFKRLEVFLTRPSLNLDGRELTTVE
jgi:hypothetical protein